MAEPAASTSNGRFSHGWLLVVLCGLFVAVILFLCLNRSVPLGVPGEWVWNRMPPAPPISLLTTGVAAAIYIGVCVVVRTKVEANAKWAIPALLLAMSAAIPLHWSLIFAPPAPLGPERWTLTLSNPASSGYFSVARDIGWSPELLRETTREGTVAFLRGYESWIGKQDSFHIGTHPPGLFLAYYWLIRWCEQHPDWVERTWRILPSRLTNAGAGLGARERLQKVDLAVLLGAAALTWLAFWSSAPLVYSLARQVATPTAALSAAMLWLLAPGPLLFLPLADVGYVFFSTAIAALLAAASRSGLTLAVVFGAIAGCLFTAALNMSLAFVVVPFFAFLAPLISDRESLFRRQSSALWTAFVVAAIGMTTCLRIACDLNLPAVFWINLQKHRGFYEHFPRSYWPWVGVNLIEFAATLGVLAVLLPGAANRRDRRARSLAWALLATLLILDLTGKNLSEAGRLWLFLTPLAAAASAPAIDGRNLSTRAFAALLLLQILTASAVYLCIEPLLPISVSS